jgi:hypothetical protein
VQQATAMLAIAVHDGTDAIIGYALAARGGPSGTFADRDGTVPDNSAVPGNHRRSERN